MFELFPLPSPLPFADELVDCVCEELPLLVTPAVALPPLPPCATFVFVLLLFPLFETPLVLVLFPPVAFDVPPVADEVEPDVAPEVELLVDPEVAVADWFWFWFCDCVWFCVLGVGVLGGGVFGTQMNAMPSTTS